MATRTSRTSAKRSGKKPARKTASRKPAAKKTVKKSAAKKPAARKTAAKKPAAKKPTAKKAAPKKTAFRKPARTKSAGAVKPKLLSGGNPQIAKGYGDDVVQEYIAAMPGWKKSVGQKLDAIIEKTVPDVHKAVKWNSPFYGFEGKGWFLSYHCFTKYIKVAFFRGASLRPIPPGESSHADVRYLDIREDDNLDEAQFADWVKQASLLPGEKM